MWIVIILMFFFAAVLEAITTLPLILIVLLSLTVIFEKSWIFVLAFFMGLFLDLNHLRNLGQSSLFFVIFLIMVLLYKRKFEIKTVPFVFFAGFLGSLGYLLIFRYDHVLWQAAVSGIFAVLIFQFLMRFSKSIDSESTAISKIKY